MNYHVHNDYGCNNSCKYVDIGRRDPDEQSSDDFHLRTVSRCNILPVPLDQGNAPQTSVRFKQHAWIFAFIFLSVLLFVPKAKADTLYFSNINNTAVGCGAGDTESCGDDGGSRTDYWTQYIGYNQSPTIKISQLDLAYCTTDVSAGEWRTFAYIYTTQEQYDNARATGNWSTYASSTSNELFADRHACGGSGGTTTTTTPPQTWATKSLTFSPAYETTVGVYAIVWRSTYSGAAPVNNPVYKTVASSYPSAVGFPTQPGYLSGSQLADNKDYAFSLWNDDQILSITYPLDQSVTNLVPVPFAGTCANDLEVNIFDSFSIASSTQQFGSSLLCNSETWGIPFTILENGYWTITASSTGEHATSTFFFLAQSQESLPTVTSTEDFLSQITSGDTSFGSCEINGFPLDLCLLANQIKGLRPYSYPLEAIALIASASQQGRASTTDIFAVPITVTSTFFTFDGVLFHAEDVYDIVPQEGWDTIRIWVNIFLYIVFAAWLIHFIRKLI